MRKVAVITTSPADYSIYRSLLDALEADERYEVGLFVTGSHLHEKFGNTVKAIRKDRRKIFAEFECLSDSDTKLYTSRSIARATEGAAEAIAAHKLDLIVTLGDRYEMLGCALAAATALVPVLHIHGGDISEGAIDDTYRRMLTKIAHLHACATDLSARRIRQMGEPDASIVVCGAPALDAIAGVKRPSRADLVDQFGLPDDRPFALVTYHPVTTDPEATEREAAALFEVLSESDLVPVMTGTNADTFSGSVKAAADAFRKTRRDAVYVESFGAANYYAAMEHAEVMIGNSSSGIIEAASLGLPVVNIGDRQKGRERSANTLDVGGSVEAIREGLTKARDEGFRHEAAAAGNVYGRGNAAKRIVTHIDRAWELTQAPKTFVLRECLETP